MKQASTTIRDALRGGLRRFSNNPREVPGLVECHNWAPAEQGLEPHEEVTSLGESGVTWGGWAVHSQAAELITIVVRVVDSASGAELQTVTVYIDDVSKGTTNASGELSIANVAVGGHKLKLTKAGYKDSDAASDYIPNDTIMVVNIASSYSYTFKLEAT